VPDTSSEFVVVLVTVSGADEGARIAEALVTERLAACVNLVGPIRSIYTWQGALHHDEEHLLLIKARGASFAELAGRVRQLHSYTTPEIIAVPISDGSEDYLRWLAAATKG
jgi:periplasmic divalent cation tolerance protein